MNKKFTIIIIIILVIYIAFLLYTKFQQSSKNKHIEQLKNALLSYALLKTSNGKELRELKNFDMNYKNFDGTRLPMFSGCSTSNACFSYIIDKEDFRKDLFYTPVMEDKIVAIEKYLEKNFDSDKKIEEFFNKFIEQIDKKEEEKSDKNEQTDKEPIEIKNVVDEEIEKKSIPVNISCEKVVRKIKEKIMGDTKKKS